MSPSKAQMATEKKTSRKRKVLREKWKKEGEMSTTGSGTEHDDVEELGDRDARFGQRHYSLLTDAVLSCEFLFVLL